MKGTTPRWKIFRAEGKDLIDTGTCEEVRCAAGGREKIRVAPQSTHVERPISKDSIEWAWNELWTKGELKQQEIFLSGSVNSAYIATLLTQLPGVTYKIKPVRLYSNKPED